MSFTSLIKRTTTKSEDMQKAMGKKEKKIKQNIQNVLNAYWPSLQNHLNQVHVIRDLNMSVGWPNITDIQGQVSMCNSKSFYIYGNVKNLFSEPRSQIAQLTCTADICHHRGCCTFFKPAHFLQSLSNSPH